MMGYSKLLLSVTVLLLLPVVAEVRGKQDCLKPTVMRQTIIRSKESIDAGAVLIGKESVSGANECYNLCCKYSTCNTAIMHYKLTVNELQEDEIQKYCYLFACIPLNVCIFDKHRRYAVIQLNTTKDVPTTSKVVTTAMPTITSKVTTTAEEESKY